MREDSRMPFRLSNSVRRLRTGLLAATFGVAALPGAGSIAHAAGTTAAMGSVPASKAPSRVQGQGMQDPIRIRDGVRYACTGIAESRNDPRWHSFPLKLVFARSTDGAYFGKADVTVRDESGRKVFAATCDNGPWLLLDLRPGTYRVEATVKGAGTHSSTVRITGERQARDVMTFPPVQTSRRIR